MGSAMMRHRWRRIVSLLVASVLVTVPGGPVSAGEDGGFCPDELQPPPGITIHTSDPLEDAYRETLCEMIGAFFRVFPEEEGVLQANIYVERTRAGGARRLARLSGTSVAAAERTFQDRNGAATGRNVVLIITKGVVVAPEFLRRLVPHELAHVLQNRYRGNRRSLSWMVEGGAMYLEAYIEERTAGLWPTSRRGFGSLLFWQERGSDLNLLPLREMEPRSRFQGSDWMIAYPSAYVAFGYLLGEDPEAGVAAYYRCFLRGRGGFPCFGYASKREFYRAYGRYAEEGYGIIFDLETFRAKLRAREVPAPALIRCGEVRGPLRAQLRMCVS